MLPFNLLYEDKEILVLEKPQGLVVHAGVNTGTTLVDYLQTYTTLAAGRSDIRPGIVHRLDKDTQGVMVVAKSDAAYAHLEDQFREKTVEKRYYAWVRGEPPHEYFDIDVPIGRSKRSFLKQQVYPVGLGKPSQTHVVVVQRCGTKALLDVKPLTGRMHQIRVHLAHLGYPIIGDGLYGPKFKSSEMGQQLQAYYLAFDHPASGDRLSFTLPRRI